MKSAIILGYHRVVAAIHTDIADRRLEVLDFAFDAQMEALARHFHVVPLLEIVERIRSGRRIGGLAAITFDDGHRSVYLNAFPLLRKRCLPSTIFLTTAPIEQQTPLWTDRLAQFIAQSANSTNEAQVDILNGIDPLLRADPRQYYVRLKAHLSGLEGTQRESFLDKLGVRNVPGGDPLSWEEAAIMHRAGVEIGIHTHSHPSLPRLSARAAVDEVRTAHRIIEDRLGVAAQTLAYPFGHVNDSVARFVESCGLRAALISGSALCKDGAHLFRLPRHRVNEQSGSEFASALVKLLFEQE